MLLIGGIQVVQGGPSGDGGKAPGDAGVRRVALPLQDSHLSLQGRFIWNAAAKTLVAEHAQLDLRHVEPEALRKRRSTAMFGGVMELQALEQPS